MSWRHLRRGSKLDKYQEYEIDKWGNRKNVLQPIADAPLIKKRMQENAQSSDTLDISDEIADKNANDKDVPMTGPNKRDRSDDGSQPSAKRDKTETPVTNLPGSAQISAQKDKETHLINPNSRLRNAQNPRRSLFPDSADSGSGSTDSNNKMDTTDEAPMPMMALQSTTTDSTSNGRKGHRAIMPLYTTPMWKFFEDRKMVRMPLKMYLSINKMDLDSPVVLKFQLNEYYRIFRNCPNLAQQTFNSPTTTKLGWNTPGNPAPSISNSSELDLVDGDITNSTDRTKGLSRDKAYDQYVSDNGTLIQKPVNTNIYEARKFPRTTPCQTAGTTTTVGTGKIGDQFGDVQPDYREWFERLYQVRHVHGCAWKLTFENGSRSDESRAVVFHKTETITPGNNSTGQNLETTKKFHEVVNWPFLQKEVLQGGYTTVSGIWRSDKGQHDVIDADEIKDWYATGKDSIPAGTASGGYEEFETLMFYAHPDAVHNPSFNCFLEIDYLVEYRDLQRGYRNIGREADWGHQTLGDTGDMYPKWPTPGATAWPTRVNLTNGELKHINNWLNNSGAVKH